MSYQLKIKLKIDEFVLVLITKNDPMPYTDVMYPSRNGNCDEPSR